MPIWHIGRRCWEPPQSHSAMFSMGNRMVYTKSIHSFSTGSSLLGSTGAATQTSQADGLVHKFLQDLLCVEPVAAVNHPDKYLPTRPRAQLGQQPQHGHLSPAMIYHALQCPHGRLSLGAVRQAKLGWACMALPVRSQGSWCKV